jgi:hypothetical protein
VSEGTFKVWVAMCTYNGAAFVEAQLEVFSGRHDAPTRSSSATMDRADATVEIVGKIAAKYPGKIQIVKNRSSRGSGGNFENAIGLTSGDIIFLADFDDVWFPDKVSTMIEAFARSPEVVLVYSDAVLTDRQLNPTGTMFDRRKAANLRKPPNLSELGRGVAFNGPMMAFHSRLKPFIIPISPLSMQWAHDHWIGFIAYAVGEMAALFHLVVRRSSTLELTAVCLRCGQLANCRQRGSSLSNPFLRHSTF